MSEHDWYGPCDALLPDGGCSVCHSAIKIKASDWCAAHREWSPCPDCETADTIARLTRERDEAIKDRAAYANALLATQRELHRLTHGNAIEGDGVCEHELRLQETTADRDKWRNMYRELHTSQSRAAAMLEGHRHFALKRAQVWKALAKKYRLAAVCSCGAERGTCPCENDE